MASRLTALTTLGPGDQARLDFFFGLRSYWANDLFAGLRRQFLSRCAELNVEAPRTPEAALPLVEGLALAPWYGWLERNVQKAKWRHLTAAVEARRDELEALLNTTVADPIGQLELNPDLPLPDYYTDIEFHIQPGGVWSDDLNAIVYELAAKVTMLGLNDDHGIHRIFAHTALPEQRDFRRILDLGCGFGKSTIPFVDRFPRAEVIGIDLSAPNLKLGHLKAEQAGKAISYSQQNAELTAFPDSSFDLVTATMLIHELPPAALRNTLSEAARLLEPGGTLAVLDFQHTGELFRDAVMDGHAGRNNEPFMPMLFRTDMARLCQAAGFRSARWHPFDERGAGLLPGPGWADRPEWHFPWAVLLAER